MIPSPLDRLLSATSGGPVLLDGGIGTLLFATHSVADSLTPRPSFWYNLSEPDMVVAAHLRFLEAGSEVLLANSFCASRPFLDVTDPTAAVGEVNRLAVKLARTAISLHGQPGKLVAGSIGPLSPEISEAEHFDLFFEQARALASSGVDLLVCETFLDTRQVIYAAEACREAASRSGRSIPVVGSITSHEPKSVKKLINLRQDGLVDLMGLNCGADFDLSESMLRALSEQSVGPFWFKPSCGTPTIREGVLKYPTSPETFAHELTELGKEIPLSAIGGCCGASPEHIGALAKSLSVVRVQVTQ